MKRVILNLLYLSITLIYLIWPISSLAYSIYMRLQSESAECETYEGNCQSFLQECEKHHLFYLDLYSNEFLKEFTIQFSLHWPLTLLVIEPLFRIYVYLRRSYEFRRDRLLERANSRRRMKYDPLLYSEPFYIKNLFKLANVQ